jgi:GT2 family glycosyltransferase
MNQISLCVSTYNRVDDLKRLLSSALTQEPPIPIIVYDDASSVRQRPFGSSFLAYDSSWVEQMSVLSLPGTFASKQHPRRLSSYWTMMRTLRPYTRPNKPSVTLRHLASQQLQFPSLRMGL